MPPTPWWPKIGGMTLTSAGAPAPPVVLDPSARDVEAENARLFAAGPLTQVVLPGGVPAWAVTRHAEALRLLTDPGIVKDVRAWDLWRAGGVPDDWPLMGLIVHRRSMGTADGAEHRRLRQYVARAMAPREVARIEGMVRAVTRELLGALPEDGGPVDLKAHFAHPLPMRVISAFMGVPPEFRPRLKRAFDLFLSTRTTGAQNTANQRELDEVMDLLVALHRARPAGGLTADLVRLCDEEGELSEDELLGTLQLLIGSGYMTTVALLLNSVVNLDVHPAQRELAVSGRASWDAVVEETMRHTPPNSNFLIRYATRDIPVGDRVLPRGEALVIAYGAIGRDPAAHGPGAAVFDLARSPNRHISFGHGPHICVGAALARLEGRIALSELYGTFPELRLAVPHARLRHIPSITQYDVESLLVQLGPRRRPPVS